MGWLKSLPITLTNNNLELPLTSLRYASIRTGRASVGCGRLVCGTCGMCFNTYYIVTESGLWSTTFFVIFLFFLSFLALLLGRTTTIYPAARVTSTFIITRECPSFSSARRIFVSIFYMIVIYENGVFDIIIATVPAIYA